MVCTLFWHSYYIIDLDLQHFRYILLFHFCMTFLVHLELCTSIYLFLIVRYTSSEHIYTIYSMKCLFWYISEMYLRIIAEIHIWYYLNVNDTWVRCIECLKLFRRCISKIFQRLFKNRCVGRFIFENWRHINNFTSWLKNI